MNRIAAVICNYNKKDDVINCVQSVLESSYKDFDIFVVDNASEDGSAEKISEIYGEQVRLFVNKENLGGSGGFNTGIRHAVEAGYDYVWCLDNDVLVDENAIGELYLFMEEHPEVGMTGSKVYHMEAPDYVQQFGINVLWDEYCCEAKYYNCKEDGTMPTVVYSDAVAACSVLVRTSLIKEIGPLPEENFLYWDDTEWGIRCHLAGYRVASLGTSKVLHSMGAKKESVNTFPLYYSWRNWIRFFMKYTREEKREDMCTAFLEGIFDVVYNDWYLKEENRAKTVMYAYDDAIHGFTGKAQKEKIFPVVHSDKKLRGLLAGKEKIVIYANGLEEAAEEFAQEVKQTADAMRLEREAAGKKENAMPVIEIRSGKGAGMRQSEKECSFTMTGDIFRLRDLELETFYRDTEGRILATEEDVLMVCGRDDCRRMFVFSQKALFMNQIL